MLKTMTGYWWLFAIRGVAAIVFGILAFAWPGLTLALLVALFAAFAIVSGVSLLVSFVQGRSGSGGDAIWTAVIGVVDVLAGIVAFILPGITALSLLYLVAAWAIIIGALQVYWAIRLRRVIEGELWTAIGGVISIAFGIYLAVLPGAGLLSLVWLVGIWAILFGLAALMFAWRLRQLGHALPGGPALA